MITVQPAKKTVRPAVSIAMSSAASRVHAATDLGAVARDDDQRVVDPHRQADERRELAGELGRVDEVRDDRDEAERRAEREHRRQQRHARGDRRAEEEQQDERGRDEADELAAAALLGEADGLGAEAAVLDAQVRPAGAERLLLDALEVRRLERLELVLVRDRRDADAPVRRELAARAPAGRRRRRRSCRRARRRSTPACFACAGAVAQRAAVRRDVDELVRAAVGLRRVGGEQVVGGLGLRVGQPEARDVARADGAADRERRDERDDPRQRT